MTLERASKVVTVLIFALLSLSPIQTEEDEATTKTKHYDLVVPNLVRIRTSTDKSQYNSGDPIIATNHLTNISGSVFLVDERSLLEGFYIHTLDKNSLCGSIGEHACGFKPIVSELASGATITTSWDVSKKYCFKGPGTYEVGGSYCHYDGKVRVHGEDSALWCVSSQPLKIVVR